MADFPKSFMWGAATASYQIEGAAQADGRGESIWDLFCRVPGNIHAGDTGDVACDHYHRWESDLDLMAELGLRGYRFSFAWPRIFPQGQGPLNPKGLDFYKRLVEGLQRRGITPAGTLYHWDLPQALQEQGGWANRDTAARFAEYAETLFRALGDQVPLWMTHNEPWCASFLGYLRGVHAPGIKDLRTALIASHHLNYSHALALAAYRAGGYKGQVGQALSLFPTYPLTDSAEDQAAARLSDGYTNRWFLDPAMKGEYPADMLAHFATLAGPLDFIRDGDLLGPMDFIGVNYYHRRLISAKPGHDLGWEVHGAQPGVPVTDMGWEIVPHCLTDLLLRLRADYGPVPIYITENGAVIDDVVEPDGQVEDPRRVEFLRGHFRAAHKAMEGGANLQGYFVWSFMDNFEWAFGYSKRFGIVHVDYATLRRTPKASARFLARVIREDGIR